MTGAESFLTAAPAAGGGVLRRLTVAGSEFAKVLAVLRAGASDRAPATLNALQNALLPADPLPQRDVASAMVSTPTTMCNVRHVLAAKDAGQPILLEGPTGVGKSATVTQAAAMAGKSLVRVNMSAKIGIDDLTGKLSFEGGKVVFKLQPFAVAFSEGHWLLLDEMNLCSDAVLQCVETALDRRQLALSDPTGLRGHFVSLSMHPDFRLFATQNPASGGFKGKREPLSAAFLDRFLKVSFQDLPADEWVQIISSKLRGDDSLHFHIADRLANTLVNLVCPLAATQIHNM